MHFDADLTQAAGLVRAVAYPHHMANPLSLHFLFDRPQVSPCCLFGCRNYTCNAAVKPIALSSCCSNSAAAGKERNLQVDVQIRIIGRIEDDELVVRVRHDAHGSDHALRHLYLSVSSSVEQRFKLSLELWK